MIRGLLAVVLAGAVVSWGCLPEALEKVSEPAALGKVQVRFLGVGGFVIRRGNDVVMTAPLYSNPAPETLAFGAICPNRKVLDGYFTAHALGVEMLDLRAILVGHAHYDHLIDVPYFLERAPNARVYGSVTTRRILSGYGEDVARRVTSLNDRADFTNCFETSAGGCVRFPGQAGEWVDVEGTAGRVRIRALCSKHPPQVFGTIHFWPGCQDKDLTLPPEKADVFREGEVFSYIIDFMEGGQPVFRVYYQDAPVSKPAGWVSEAVVSDHPVDLALLCAGNFDVVEAPESLVSDNLHATAVVIHHWEDFFDPNHSKLAMIPGCDVNLFCRRILARMGGDKSRVLVLSPGVLRNFPRDQKGREEVRSGS